MKDLIEARENLLKILVQKSEKENWDPMHLLEGILITTYTNYIVMMESRK